MKAATKEKKERKIAAKKIREKTRQREGDRELEREREKREEGEKRGKKEGKNGDGLPPPSLPRLVSSQPGTKREVREATHSSEKIMQTVRKRRGIPQSPHPRLIATNPFRPFPVLTFQHAGRARALLPPLPFGPMHLAGTGSTRL